MLGLFPAISFEAQSAMALQFLCGYGDISELGSYNYSIEKDQMNIIPLLQDIVKDIRSNTSHRNIAGKFHNTIVEMTLSAILKVRKTTGLSKVVLSGGVMQNSILFHNLVKKLSKNNFTVIKPEIIPPNDSSISLGQAVIANKIFQR